MWKIVLHLGSLICSMNALDTVSITDATKCFFNNNGTLMTKAIGEIWTHLGDSGDICVKHVCDMDINGIAVESIFHEYCNHQCEQGFRMVHLKGECCGECVPKRCSYKNQTYNIGDIWKSNDSCLFYECVDDDVGTRIITFKKSCPTLKDCPTKKVVFEDCCPFCLRTKSHDYENDSDVFNILDLSEKDHHMSRDTYLKHPCRRECVKNAAPEICNYKFIVEWYVTLSKACWNCPYNNTDCFRPHCVSADGFRRSILVVNRMMPGPLIDVCKGDTIVVDVENELMGESTTIHWHGLHQRGTPFFDGVPQVTQCPILPQATFRYKFKALNTGTHWWHSHVGTQRGDGTFGALIIREPIVDLPNIIRKVFDENTDEFHMIFHDWDHRETVPTFNIFHHSMGDNKPQNILINGHGRYSEPNSERNKIDENSQSDLMTKATTIAPYETFNVHEGLKYRFRVINAGFLNCPLELSVDNHTILVIGSDGHYIEPVWVDSLVSYAGERFDFILYSDQPIGNYWIRAKGLIDCDERFTKAHQGAILHYHGAENKIPDELLSYNYKRTGFQMNSLNRGPDHLDSVAIVETTSLEPDTPELLSEKTDFKFYVYYDFYEKNFPQFNHPELYSIKTSLFGKNKFFGSQLNRISMKLPSTPLLIGRQWNDESKFCNESSLAEHNINCVKDFCGCLHVLQVPLNSTVEVILIDEGYKFDANHPFHLHGHDFRVVAMERVKSSGISLEEVKMLDKTNKIKRRLKGAPKKDTITVPDGGYTVIRFLADNPGFWLFHCHIDFHVEVGMSLIFKIGDYNQMQSIPRDFPVCSNYDQLKNLSSEMIDSNDAPHHMLSTYCWIISIIYISNIFS
ncbi:laccase-1-like [Contarinia nasturtii]|uniref:laccase-1-like n=1 Tax=Contarinia nasturtii TaxID=265458 RepID=UPI0012D42C5B|nr:laccase-1-like [Contarinia nasturtii]